MHKNFDVVVADTLEQALTLLRKEKGARPILGGTDLLLQLEKGFLSSELLVDITRIPEISYIKEGASQISIGAGITHAAICEWTAGHSAFAALYEASSSIGTPQVRNRATLMGNLCNAVPSADGAPPVLVLGGHIVAASLEGKRNIPLEKFFVGPKRTILRPDELAVELILPKTEDNTVSCYRKFGPRKAADLAYVGVAVLLREDRSRKLTDLRIALGAVGPTPILVGGTEQFLGHQLDDQMIDQCSRLAAAAARPITDFRATAEYRRALVEIEVSRALTHCRAQMVR